jgi:hypothetical protein
MCFVFSNILALFPLFLNSLAVPPGFPQSSNFVPCRIPHDPVSRRNVCGVKKLEFWLYVTHLSTQLGFVLGSF